MNDFYSLPTVSLRCNWKPGCAPLWTEEVALSRFLSCVKLHFSTSPGGPALFSEVRGSSVNLPYSVLWERPSTFLTHIWYYITDNPSIFLWGSYCSEEQPTKCKQVLDINIELKPKVKMGTLAYSCPWAWQEIYFAVAEK